MLGLPYHWVNTWPLIKMQFHAQLHCQVLHKNLTLLNYKRWANWHFKTINVVSLSKTVHQLQFWSDRLACAVTELGVHYLRRFFPFLSLSPLFPITMLYLAGQRGVFSKVVQGFGSYCAQTREQGPPSTPAELFFSTHVCKVTFKSYTKFGILGQLLNSPPFVRPNIA